MKPKLLLNLILLFVLAVLAGVAIFEPGKEEPKTVYLTNIDVDNLDRFELVDSETLAFERIDGHWYLKSPFNAPASEFRIRQLLDIAKAESRASYPLKSEDLAKFELDKPKAVLTFGQTKLIFGGSEPIDMLRYVQVGDTLHLVTDDFSQHLLAKSTDFVDKKLLPEDTSPKEILLPGLKGALGEKGQWSVEPSGDVSAMAELATAWQSARAIEVKRNEQPAKGDLVHIGLNNGQAVEFAILQREPELLLLRPDLKLEYLLAAESGKRLLSLQKPSLESEKQEEEDLDSPPEAAPDETMENEPGQDVEVDGE